MNYEQVCECGAKLLVAAPEDTQQYRDRAQHFFEQHRRNHTFLQRLKAWWRK